MDLLEKIDVSIKSLEDPENNIFDFDREIELLDGLKKLIAGQINEKDIIERDKKEIEKLNKHIKVIENKNSTLEVRIKGAESELDNFRNLILKEILSKMRLLDYPDDEIVNGSEKKAFSEICKLREKIFIEFDMRFKISQMVKDTPKKEILNYSLFKA